MTTAGTPPGPARTRGRRRLAVVVTVIVVLAVAAAVLVVSIVDSNTAQIRRTVTDFTAAVDANDVPAMAEQLCDDEATALAEDDGYDPDAVPVPGQSLGSPTVTDVRVDPTGTRATATVQLPNRPVITLDLVDETGGWKLCTTAANGAAGAAAPAGLLSGLTGSWHGAQGVPGGPQTPLVMTIDDVAASPVGTWQMPVFGCSFTLTPVRSDGTSADLQATETTATACQDGLVHLTRDATGLRTSVDSGNGHVDVGHLTR